MSEQEVAALTRWLDAIRDQDSAPTDDTDEDGE